MKKVIVGSTSIHKIEAVKEALRELGVEAEVSGIKTESGVNEQPVGLTEAWKGAASRAYDAYSHYQADNPLTIGIESGIECCNSATVLWESITIDIAVIVLRLAADKYIVSTSPGIQFPQDMTYRAKRLGFGKHTVGEVIAEKLGGDKTDPHSTLTYGRVNRKETLVQGIKLAFAQIPDLQKFFE